MTLSRWFTYVAALATLAPGAFGESRHVVLLVWDGMRPDFVTEKTTPTLFALSQRGVFFAHQHSVFVTSTEVNGTALSTGMNPTHSGVMANMEYRPAIDPFNAIGVESAPSVRRGDRVTGGHYLRAATVAEILQAQSPALRTVVAGSKGVALLLDRRVRGEEAVSPLLVEGETQPISLLDRIVGRLGPFPAIGVTKIDRDIWTTRALLEQFWGPRLPAFTVLWLAEPDWAQHHTGPGSAPSLAAIGACDQKLALVLRALSDRHALGDADVLVVSDHGFSTIERNADLAVDLSKAGLNTARAFTSVPPPGTILVTGLGASSGLYVTDHRSDVVHRAVTFLQQQDYTGVIFTRIKMEGTFPLSLVKIDTPDAPDILVTLRWKAERSSTGVPGMEVSETGAGRKPGQGTHACLSPTDLHNTLVAAGPDFRSGWVDELPSGNVDVAPTILWILGVTPPVPMDGRVLSEALSIPGPKPGAAVRRREESARHLGTTTWHQYLDVSTVGGVSYFEEGNGAATAQP